MDWILGIRVEPPSGTSSMIIVNLDLQVLAIIVSSKAPYGVSVSVFCMGALGGEVHAKDHLPATLHAFQSPGSGRVHAMDSLLILEQVVFHHATSSLQPWTKESRL